MDTFNQIKQLLIDEFELNPASVTADARLYEDLEIDSIDAVDLLVRLREVTGKHVAPERFRSVRTLGDVVAALEDA